MQALEVEHERAARGLMQLGLLDADAGERQRRVVVDFEHGVDRDKGLAALVGAAAVQRGLHLVVVELALARLLDHAHAGHVHDRRVVHARDLLQVELGRRGEAAASADRAVVVGGEDGRVEGVDAGPPGRPRRP